MTKTEETPEGPVRWLMLAGVWSIYFCFGLTATALAPVVAPVIRDLDMNHTQMGSVLGAWQLVYIAAAVPCGIVVDRLRPRRALLLGALLIAASGFARSISQDYLTLFLAVGLFGLGGPIVSTGAPKVVAQWFKGTERGLAMGIYVSGPFLGGAVTLVVTNSVLMPAFNENWRLVLALWAALAVISALIWWIVSANPRALQKEDAMAGEAQVPSTLEIWRLLQVPSVQIVLVMAVCIFMINHGFGNWLPEILRTGHLDAATAGYYAAFPTMVAVVASLTVPRLAVPARRFWILGGLAAASGIGCLLILSEPGPAMGLGLLLQGVSRGAMMSIALLILMELPEVGEKRVGTASGMFFSAAEIGGMGGPLALGIVYDVTQSFVTGLYMLSGFSAMIVACVALLALNAKKPAALP